MGTYILDFLMFRIIRWPKWEGAAAPEIVIRFALSDGTKSFGVALRNLGVAPKVGVAGVAPEVGEKAPLCTPLCTLLAACSRCMKCSRGRVFQLPSIPRFL